jgi:HSP20 family protein
MSTKKESALAQRTGAADPFSLVRQMASELDRMFDDIGSPFGRWPELRARPLLPRPTWLPELELFEKDNRLVTRIDLPGLKKEDVKVEVTDGHLAISGERKSETEEKKERFYRSERQYGSFYRAIPLPEGVKVEDVKATFTDGVLEVSVPLPAKPQAAVRTVEVQDGAKATKPAAA